MQTVKSNELGHVQINPRCLLNVFHTVELHHLFRQDISQKN